MGRKGYPSEKQDQYMLRLPDGMRDRIKAVAAKNNRSMNAEIIASLEEVYPDLPTVEEFIALIETAQAQLEQIEKGPEWAEASRNLIELIEAVQAKIRSRPSDDD